MTPKQRLMNAVDRCNRLRRMAIDIGVMLRDARQELRDAEHELLTTEAAERAEELQASR